MVDVRTLEFDAYTDVKLSLGKLVIIGSIRKVHMKGRSVISSVQDPARSSNDRGPPY